MTRAWRELKEKKYDAAFRNFDYLLHNTTPTPALRIAVLEYLLENAGVLLAEQKTDHALAILEEITQRDADFRTAEVNEQLSRAADLLIGQAVEKADYAQARGVMLRLEERYGASRIAALQGWREQIVGQATQLKTQAEQKMAEGAWREAEQLSRQLEAMWPDLPGAANPAARDLATLPHGFCRCGRVGLGTGRDEPRELACAADGPAHRTPIAVVPWCRTGRWQVPVRFRIVPAERRSSAR